MDVSVCCQVPPILLPVQLTLVPEKVSTFNDVTNALRHCVQVRQCPVCMLKLYGTPTCHI